MDETPVLSGTLLVVVTVVVFAGEVLVFIVVAEVDWARVVETGLVAGQTDSVSV